MDRDTYYMQMAFLVAKRSKCLRAQYGSVLVSSDDRVIATGYNGKPRGSCNDKICYREGLPDNARVRIENSGGSMVAVSLPNCCLHSEANCLMFSSPLERQGATLYVSGVPCTDCALLIAQSGINRLVYFSGETEHGHKGNFDLEFYKKYGMGFEVVRMNFPNVVGN